MAKIAQLPSKKVVDAFRGILDFYTWCDLTIVRKWPRAPGRRRNPAVVAAQQPFIYINQLQKNLGEDVLDSYKILQTKSGLTWKDFLTRFYINGSINADDYQADPPQESEGYPTMKLVILDSEIEKVDWNNIAASVPWTDIDLSAQVTPDTTHAIMRIRFQCNSVANVGNYGCTMRQKGGGQTIECARWWAQVTTSFAQIHDTIVPLDADKKIQYKVVVPAGGNGLYVNIWLVGYYEQI